MNIKNEYDEKLDLYLVLFIIILNLTNHILQIMATCINLNYLYKLFPLANKQLICNNKRSKVWWLIQKKKAERKEKSKSH